MGSQAWQLVRRALAVGGYAGFGWLVSNSPAFRARVLQPPPDPPPLAGLPMLPDFPTLREVKVCIIVQDALRQVGQAEDVGARERLATDALVKLGKLFHGTETVDAGGSTTEH